MIPRRALLAVSLLLPALAAGVAVPSGAAAQQDGEIAPVDVVIELRVWQHVDDAEDIRVSTRPLGGDWDNPLGTIPFLLEHVYEARGHHIVHYHHYGDLKVADATLRIWQRSDRPDDESIFVCAHRCPDPWPRTIPRPLGAIPLPLDDGHSADGQYRYGDLKIATVPGNPGLLTDRVRLLRLRDTLAGTGTLNWDHDTPMTTWTGVTIGGKALRVRGLDLTGSGLTGELSGLLGELTSLEELWLDGNALTGAIPSKLSQLTRLTHLYLGGNGITRCVSPSLRAVPNNDLDSLGLPDCPPPREVRDGDAFLTDGSYVVVSDDLLLVFDVPAGIQLTMSGPYGVYRHNYPYWLLLDHVDSQSGMGFVLADHFEYPRSVDPTAPGVASVFDRINESAWIGAPDTPYTRSPPAVRPALTAVSSGRAGEILLEWTSTEVGAIRWQYRQRGPGQAVAWGPWTDLPRSGAGTRSHRLTDLQPEGVYKFEVRAWTTDGAGDASFTREAVALRAGLDGIPIALPGTPLEGGRSFRVGESAYTFTVPEGLPLALWGVTLGSGGSIRIFWEEPGGSDWVAYDTATRSELGGEGSHDTWALYTELLESVREDPPESVSEDPLSDAGRSVGPTTPAVAIVLLGLIALAVARWRGRV